MRKGVATVCDLVVINEGRGRYCFNHCSGKYGYEYLPHWYVAIVDVITGKPIGGFTSSWDSMKWDADISGAIEEVERRKSITVRLRYAIMRDW